MKNLHDIEKLLKSLAPQRQAVVDTDELWQQIQGSLPEKKRRRILPFWILGIGVIATAFAFFRIEPSSTENSLNSELAIEVNEVSETTNHPKGASDYNNELEDGATIKNASNFFRSEHKIKKSGYTTEEGQREKDVASPANEFKSKQTASNIQVDNAQYLALSKVRPDQRELITEELILEDPYSGEMGKVMRSNKLEQSNKRVITNNLYNNELEKIRTQASNPLLVPVVYENKSRVSSLSFMPIGILKLDTDFYRPEPLRVRMSWEEPIYNWVINMSGGYSNSLTSYKLRNTDLIEHFNNRNTNERALSSWHIGVSTAYRLNTNWSIRGGVRYSNIYRRSTATISMTETLLLDDVVIERIVGPDGTELVRGSVEVLQETVSQVNRINRFQSFNIELTMLRHIDISVLEAYIGIGLSRGLLLNQEGYIHPSGSEEYNISQDVNGWYKRNQGFGGLLELGLSYPVSDRSALNLYGLYKLPFESVSTEVYDLIERRSTYHIGVGLNFKL